MRPETVMIEGQNGPVMINKSDYNPQEHKLAEGMPEVLMNTTALTPAGPVGTDANGNPVNQGDGGQWIPGQLRQDGPTVAEYVAAGYSADNYPPNGYASRSTPEEIEAAKQPPQEAQQPQTDANGNPANQTDDASKQTVPPMLFVTKNDKRKFIVIDADQKPVATDGIEADGYKTEKEAWDAINAHNAKLSGSTA